MTLKNYRLKCWMTDLPSHLKDIPIIYLAIPGSHNTFSYSISKNSNVSPDAPALVQQLSLLAKPVVNPFIYKWSRTQNFSVEDQLLGGIRYLDIRVAIKNGMPVVCHGLYGGPIHEYLFQISEFLNENKGEVVILDFQHFYNFSVSDHKNLITNIYTVFEKRLCPVDNFKTFTLNYLIKRGVQVIVVYRCDEVQEHSFLWPSTALPTPWPNKLTVAGLKAFLENALKTRDNDMGFVTQSLLTVDTKYVIQHPCRQLKSMAFATNSEMSPWLKSHNSGPNGVNIVICDFVQDCDFINNVIDLNMTPNLRK